MVKLGGNYTKQEITADRLKELKAEVSKKASMANKRIKRLENKGMTNNPAYRNWEQYNNGQKFSVKGKNYNQLQQELSRVNSFIGAKTSTIRGTNKVLKEIASNTGIKYKKVGELYEKSAKFFELASKVGQYMKNVNMSGQAMGYQKLWQTINEYTESKGIDLSGDNVDVDQFIKEISDLTSKSYEDENLNNIPDDFDVFNL